MATPHATGMAVNPRFALPPKWRTITMTCSPATLGTTWSLSRSMRLGLVAAAEAVSSAGLDERPDIRAGMACLMAVERYDINLEDFGESFARAISADADAPSGFSFSRQKYLSRSHRAAHPLWLLKFIPNLAVAHVVRTFGMQCEANAYTSESAASLQLLGDAAESIRDGLFDAALCGASDSRISPLGIERYLSLNLLAPGTPDDVSISMPFDRKRRGYVLGEGAVFLVVEALDHAERRGVRPLAELAGWDRPLMPFTRTARIRKVEDSGWPWRRRSTRPRWRRLTSIASQPLPHRLTTWIRQNHLPCVRRFRIRTLP